MPTNIRELHTRIVPLRFNNWPEVREAFRLDRIGSEASTQVNEPLVEQARGIYNALLKEDNRFLGMSAFAHLGILAKVFGDTQTLEEVIGRLDNEIGDLRKDRGVANFHYAMIDTLALLVNGDIAAAGERLKESLKEGDKDLTVDHMLLAWLLGRENVIPDDLRLMDKTLLNFPEHFGIFLFVKGRVSEAENELRKIDESASKGRMQYQNRKFEFYGNCYACILALMVAGVDIRGLIPDGGIQ
jgi:hypothetical protein